MVNSEKLPTQAIRSFRRPNLSDRGAMKSAKAHAHQGNGGGERGPECVKTQLAGLDKCWDDGSEHHEVEAVQHHGQPTEPDRPLGAAGR